MQGWSNSVGGESAGRAALGEIVAGKFELVECLGGFGDPSAMVPPVAARANGARAASTGVVYRARHVRLGSEVVVKLFHPQFPRQQVESWAEALVSAAQICAPHAPSVFDCGSIVIGGHRRGFVVVEHLVGESLQERLGRGSMSRRELLVMVEQLARALGNLHARGRAHGHLTAGNVFQVTEDDEVVFKLLDCGVVVDESTSVESGRASRAGRGPSPAEDRVALGELASMAIGPGAPEPLREWQRMASDRNGGFLDVRAAARALRAALAEIEEPSPDPSRPTNEPPPVPGLIAGQISYADSNSPPAPDPTPSFGAAWAGPGRALEAGTVSYDDGEEPSLRPPALLAADSDPELQTSPTGSNVLRRAASPDSLHPALVEQLTELLEVYLGESAGLILRLELERFGGAPRLLVERLSQHLPSDGHRVAFVTAARAVLQRHGVALRAPGG